jgi:hypothetical protein
MKNLNVLENVSIEVAPVKLPGIPEIKLNFLNGSITIPNRHGGYVIASGCGSGKTTAIKKLILNQFNYGIVYSAFTIKECNEMYEFLVDNGESVGLSPDDIVVFHSNYNDKGVDNNLLKNMSNELANKKVIICTHHKLLNEYPEAFLIYNRNKIFKSRYSLLTRGKISWDENGVKKYPRQYIIIDEMPTCSSFSFNVDKNLIRLLGVADTVTKYDEEGNPYLTAKLPIRYTNGNDYSITEELYKGAGIDLFNTNSESGKLKNGLALSMVYENYDGLMNILDSSIDKRPSVTMSYTIADQIASGDCSGETRYLIFDGTGDLTFKDSKVFDLLTFDNKYSSPICIHKIHMGYKRSYKNETDFENHRTQLIENLNIRINDLKRIIESNEGVLIVTWKNLKVKGEERGVPIFGVHDKREVNYTDYIKSELNKSGFIEGKDYSVIHYQSGLDKATNEFRDYNSVVFLGEFHVPNYVVDKFNQDYRTNTNPNDYLTYQLSQAVCRTRIRKHNGDNINIYYTDDWDNTSIDNLSHYLSNKGNGKEVSDTSLSHIKNKWRPIAEMLGELDDNFRHALQTRTPYKLKFNLDDIYELIPMNEKKVKLYYPMINYFRKLGVEIVITSPDTRFKSKE